MVDVLLDARIVARGHTGIARYVQELAPRLASGHGLAIDALVNDGTPLAGCGVVRARSAFLSPLEQAELPLLIARWKREHRAGVTWIPAYDVPIAAPGPLVVTVHDANHIALPGRHARLHAAYYRAIVKTGCDRAAAVLAPSDFAKREIVERIGVDAAKVVVTRLGVHVPTRPDPAAIARMRETRGLAKPYVAYLGNFKAHKNVGALLRAAPAFARDATLLLVGGREEELGSALDEARRQGCDVRVLPSVSDAELWPLLAGASVFAFPSKYEGFGLPPLEAMALGVPVVSSTAGSLAELVEGAALTVHPDDADGFGAAIARVLGDPALAADLVEKGRARAATFTWEKCAAETAAVLRRAAS